MRGVFASEKNGRSIKSRWSRGGASPVVTTKGSRRLRSLSSTFGQRMAELEEQAHKLAGRPFNIGSPRQIGEILFGDIEYYTSMIRATRTSQFDADALVGYLVGFTTLSSGMVKAIEMRRDGKWGQ